MKNNLTLTQEFRKKIKQENRGVCTWKLIKWACVVGVVNTSWERWHAHAEQKGHSPHQHLVCCCCWNGRRNSWPRKRNGRGKRQQRRTHFSVRNITYASLPKKKSNVKITLNYNVKIKKLINNLNNYLCILKLK